MSVGQHQIMSTVMFRLEILEDVQDRHYLLVEVAAHLAHLVAKEEEEEEVKVGEGVKEELPDSLGHERLLLNLMLKWRIIGEVVRRDLERIKSRVTAIPQGQRTEGMKQLVHHSLLRWRTTMST